MKRTVLTIVAFSLVSLFLYSCSSNVEKTPNSIAVTGKGVAMAQPDIAEMRVRIAHTAPTVQDAKKAVEQAMTQITEILQQQKVESKFMKTLSLNYEVEYSYKNGNRVRLGQQAEQTILVTVNNLIDNPQRLYSILDQIVSVNDVEIQNINFDIEKKADFFKKSREMAYQKALEKAKQYAELSGRKLGKVMHITEKGSLDMASYNRNLMNNLAKEEADYGTGGGSTIPTGEQDITSEIDVVFSLK